MATKPEDAPANEVQTIDDSWGESDLPRIDFDSLLTLPILVTQAEVRESDIEGREGSLWGTFEATLLAASKRGIVVKGSGEVIDAEIGTKFTASSGARRVTAMLKAMAQHGFEPGYAVIPSKVSGDTSGKARMLAKVEPEAAAELVAKLPKVTEDA